MALRDDLSSEVGRIFREQWQKRDGRTVPEPHELGLAKNDAVYFKRATVLYADLSDSTVLVNAMSWTFAAEVYQSYLYCAARIIRDQNGVIVAYDGDRVMAIYLGDYQSTNAVKAGLKINYAVKFIINPALRKQYPDRQYTVNHTVGIDTSEIRVARTGVRGGNDLVWVGRAANYAAKLNSLSHDYPTRITADVFKVLADEGKYGGDPRKLMWEACAWTANGNLSIYRSNWRWKI